ncbi:dihydropteroate synthase [Actinomycetes bacterium]|nr:dihydropteroate synthase [Actinomycetes bacterium]
MNTNPTIVMGILNITPDSFADGGRHFNFVDAINRGESMIAEGAEIIDVGGESTRPGAERITEVEERNRVMPVIAELKKLGAVISIDTMRAKIANEAILAGATYINDVSGGLADPDMVKTVVANPQIQYIAMHWRAHSKNMQDLAAYKDVVREVKDELQDRIDTFISAGADPDQLIIDPGLGFAKTGEHNWEILRNLDRLALLGFPILIGASRKKFLGELTKTTNPDDREAASIAITSLVAKTGLWGVRTHTVKPHKDAIATVNAMERIK